MYYGWINKKLSKETTGKEVMQKLHPNGKYLLDLTWRLIPHKTAKRELSFQKLSSSIATEFVSTGHKKVKNTNFKVVVDLR